jgi:hypothetical protein
VDQYPPMTGKPKYYSELIRAPQCSEYSQAKIEYIPAYSSEAQAYYEAKGQLPANPYLTDTPLPPQPKLYQSPEPQRIKIKEATSPQYQSPGCPREIAGFLISLYQDFSFSFSFLQLRLDKT